MPSASVGEHTSYMNQFQALVSAATGLNIANPLATILSAAMMFEDAFDYTEEAAKSSSEQIIGQGIVTEDLAAKEQPQ
jgi:3-isopropylmalate dehydrogenase